MSHRRIIFLAIIFLIIFFGLKLFLFKSHFIPLPQVCFKNYCFEVELADTLSEQTLGLMFRKNLDLDKGMLFIFDEEKEHAFWMKNTLIPLDIIWLNGNQEIVFISKNTQPCQVDSCPIIQPNKKAKYVLEINGGLADKIGLKEGDQLTLEIRQ